MWDHIIDQNDNNHSKLRSNIVLFDIFENVVFRTQIFYPIFDKLIVSLTLSHGRRVSSRICLLKFENCGIHTLSKA